MFSIGLYSFILLKIYHWDPSFANFLVRLAGLTLDHEVILPVKLPYQCCSLDAVHVYYREIAGWNHYTVLDVFFQWVSTVKGLLHFIYFFHLETILYSHCLTSLQEQFIIKRTNWKR